MQATLNIEGLAYCTIEIEGASVPPSSNMLRSIMIMDGFGMGLPVMQMVLNDETESLSSSLAIKDGTRIIIKMGRDTKNIIERAFRIFGWKRGRGTAGPRIEIAALLDVPLFGAGVFSEAFRATSDEIMKKIAQSCGLRYEGPKTNTNDLMTWININTTRLSFSEDVAMRGYASEQSAMSRILTMDNILRYKNLFEVLAEPATHTFVHNTGGKGHEGKLVPVREAKDASASGFSTHHLNYGQKHFMHSLAGEDAEILSVTVPLLGAGLPVNDDVRSEIENRGARVTYSGFDPGTGPDPDDAVHEYYEAAYYQNLRFLSLFSERVTLLTDECTEAKTFDPVAYILNSQRGSNVRQSEDVSSKYLLGGKTILIKNGLRYAEAHFLYRPFITAVGLGAAAGSSNDSSTKQNAKANASGDLNPAVMSVDTPNATNVSQQIVSPANAPAIPAAQAAKDSMVALSDFDSVTPRIPVTPTNLAPDAQARAAMDNVRSSTDALNKVGGPLGDSIKAANKLPADTSYFQRVTNFSKDFIKSLTGNFNMSRIASDIDYARSNSAGFKAHAIGRVSGAFGDVSGFRVNNIVSAATGGSFNQGQLVGEVLGGGIWIADLEKNGMGLSNLNLPFKLPLIDSAAGKVGTNFLMDMTGFGLSSDNITINPHKTARAINSFANSTNPQNLLLSQGADAYIKTFGNVSPTDAATSLQELSVISAKVMKQYGENEYLTDEQRTNKALIFAGKETLFSFGGKGITPVVQSVEQVVDYGGYQNVQTVKQATTWARLYSMGENVKNKVGAWEPPVFPSVAEETDTTAGLSNSFSSNVSRWFNS